MLILLTVVEQSTERRASQSLTIAQNADLADLRESSDIIVRTLAAEALKLAPNNVIVPSGSVLKIVVSAHRGLYLPPKNVAQSPPTAALKQAFYTLKQTTSIGQLKTCFTYKSEQFIFSC